MRRSKVQIDNAKNDLVKQIDFDKLPEDKSVALLQFEDQLRKAAGKLTSSFDVRRSVAGQHPSTAAEMKLEYHQRVWQAYYDLLSVFCAEYEFKFGVTHPNLQNINFDEISKGEFDNRVRDILTQVDDVRFAATLKISKAGKDSIKEVTLSPAVKQQVRDLANKIREKIEESDIPARKRESLLASLANFEAELDFDSTRLERFTQISLDLADTGTEVAKRLSGARRLVKMLEKVLGRAKENEGIKRLGHEELFKIEDKTKEELGDIDLD